MHPRRPGEGEEPYRRGPTGLQTTLPKNQRCRPPEGGDHDRDTRDIQGVVRRRQTGLEGPQEDLTELGSREWSVFRPSWNADETTSRTRTTHPPRKSGGYFVSGPRWI